MELEQPVGRVAGEMGEDGDRPGEVEVSVLERAAAGRRRTRTAFSGGQRLACSQSMLGASMSAPQTSPASASGTKWRSVRPAPQPKSRRRLPARSVPAGSSLQQLAPSCRGRRRRSRRGRSASSSGSCRTRSMSSNGGYGSAADARVLRRARRSELLGDPRRLAVEEPDRRARRRATKIATAGSRCSQPPAASTAPAALGIDDPLVRLHEERDERVAEHDVPEQSRSGTMLTGIEHRAPVEERRRGHAPDDRRRRAGGRRAPRGRSRPALVRTISGTQDQREQQPGQHRVDAEGER